MSGPDGSPVPTVFLRLVSSSWHIWVRQRILVTS